MKRNVSIILLLAGWVLSLQAQTAVDLLQSAVKQQLQQWTVKGEFEKTSAYKARIQERVSESSVSYAKYASRNLRLQ